MIAEREEQYYRHLNIKFENLSTCEKCSINRFMQTLLLQFVTCNLTQQ